MAVPRPVEEILLIEDLAPEQPVLGGAQQIVFGQSLEPASAPAPRANNPDR